MRVRITFISMLITVVAWVIGTPLAVAVETKMSPGSSPREVLLQVDQLGGAVHRFFRYGAYTVIARSGQTEIYEHSDPATPVLVARIPHFTAQAMSGNYLYGGPPANYPAYPPTGADWQVWDISIPQAPTLAGRFYAPGELYAATPDVLVFGESPYEGSLLFYSLSDLSIPRYAGRWDSGLAPGSGQLAWATAMGHHLLVSSYTLSCHGGCITDYRPLKIIDISNPASPAETGEGTDEMSESSALAQSGEYLYQVNAPIDGVPSSSYRLYVRRLDESGPGIVTLSELDLGDFEAGSVTAYGSFLYLSDGHDTKVIDVSDPAAPVEVALLPEWIAGDLFGDFLYRRHAYPGYQATFPYVSLFALSDPHAPTLVTVMFHPAGERAASAAGDRLFILDSTRSVDTDPERERLYLHMVDTSVAEAPRLVRTDLLRDFAGSDVPEMEIVEDSYLYLVYRGYGIDIYTLPTADTPPEFVRTIADSNLNSIAVLPNALLARPGPTDEPPKIYDITDPANPLFTTHLDVTYINQAPVITEGDRAYFYTEREWGHVRHIVVADLADPHAPEVLASIPMSGPIYSWTVRDGFLYYFALALTVMDVRDPAHPVTATYPSLPPPGSSFDLDLSVDASHLYAAITNGRFDLYAYRLDPDGVPRPPVALHEETNYGWGGEVTLGQQTVYFSDELYGLRTYQFAPARTHFLPGIANGR